MAKNEHRYKIESREGARTQGHVVVCSCGWESPVFSSAGLAGSAHDRHVTTVAGGNDPTT